MARLSSNALQLTPSFAGRFDISEAADWWVFDTQMNDERAPPFATQPRSDFVEVPIRRRLALALGKVVDAGAQHLTQ